MARRDHDDGADEGELFRAAVGPVRRLPDTPAPPAPPKPAPRARMAERDEANALSEFRQALQDEPLLAGDVLSYRRDPVPLSAWQRLRRGDLAVQDELDLHGATAREAEAMLRDFLHAAHRSGFGCVRIVHGKGRRAAELVDDGGLPVLKNLVDRVLRQRSEVMAFHSAPPAQGGTGAVLVLLAPPKRR
jgi:DNA-nicking Smr family endonuclease